MIRPKILRRAMAAIEDLMIETAFKDNVEERAIWWACLPLWRGLTRLIREAENAAHRD